VHYHVSVLVFFYDEHCRP